MRIILLGVPGAGKGTQAEIISKRLSIPTISTGNVLRAAIKAETPLGLEVKDLLARGELVSDEIILEIMRDRVAEADCQNGYILDGVPRTVAQAEGLEDLGVEIDLCLLLEVPDAVVIDRLSGRRACPNCGNTFHVTANPPLELDVCDHCATGLIIRPDDEASTVERRLLVFREQTAPLIDFYQTRGKLKTVSNLGSVEDVSQEVFHALGVTL